MKNLKTLIASTLLVTGIAVHAVEGAELLNSIVGREYIVTLLNADATDMRFWLSGPQKRHLHVRLHNTQQQAVIVAADCAVILSFFQAEQRLLMERIGIRSINFGSNRCSV